MSPGRRSQLLLIAAFARRCRLPVSTLRYYDRLGLLRPAEVDPHSGYRRYAADQLATAITIARLRAIGTSPRDIGRLLAGGEQADTTLAAERRRLTAEIAERTHALTRLDELATEPTIGLESPAHIVDLAAGAVCALAFTTRFDDLQATITRQVATLRTVLRGQDLHPEGWGALLPLDLDEDVRGHVFARTCAGDVVEPVGNALLTTELLPRGRAVGLIHHGSYDELALAYDAALARIEGHGARPSGPIIEDYLRPGTDGRPRVRITVPMTP